MAAEVSAAERESVTHGVAQGVRNAGRGRGDCRPLELELGAVARASGSARARAGATDVIAAVRLSLGPPDADAPGKGQVSVSVEISACASPEFRGRAGEDWGIDLAAALQAALRSTLDLGALCVLPGKTAWHVYVDALVLNDGGGALAVISAAARAALASTRLPRVEVTMGEGGGDGDDDGEPEIEVGDEESGAPLDVSAVPVVVTVARVGARCAVDPTAEEEAAAQALLHVAVGAAGRVAGASKAGGGGVAPALLGEMLEAARRVGPEVVRAIDAFVAGGGGGGKRGGGGVGGAGAD